jgi:hypothetical protein
MSVHGDGDGREYGDVICCNDYDYVSNIDNYLTSRSGFGSFLTGLVGLWSV